MTKKVAKKAKVKKVEKKEAPVATQTVADKIWDAIQNVQLDLFALPDQTVGKYCSPAKIDPNKLYLSHKGIGALLPAMETALSKKYNVELVDKYIVVSNKS